VKYSYVLISIIVLNSYFFCHAENWAQWRGPYLNGSSEETGLPATWNIAADTVWKTPLPGPGSATPIIFDTRVFVTASEKASKQVLAIGLDAEDGHILWQHPLGPDRKTAGRNNMASPSPVTDGKHVWFLTGNGILAAFTINGKAVWKRDLAEDYGEFTIFFGYSSSPLLHQGKLYVLALQNNQINAYKRNTGKTGLLDSYLLAIDPQSGQTLWRHVRDTDAEGQSRESYVTPLPYEKNGSQQIVLSGGECVTGHDAATGEEIWRWWFTPKDRKKLQHNVPTPVTDGDRIFVVRPEHRPLYAIRPENKKLLNEKHNDWIWQDNRCWIASPLLYKERLYVLQEKEKSMACIEPKTGRVIWQHELPAKKSFYASPTGADGKVYCITLGGEVIVLAAEDEYRLLGTADFDEHPCSSTIAVAGGRLFVRTPSMLYCIGNQSLEAK